MLTGPAHAGEEREKSSRIASPAIVRTPFWIDAVTSFAVGPLNAKEIGVEIRVEVIEPAVFLASVRKGAYQLALGRWVGVADASILDRTLRSSSPGNRSGYSNPQVDDWLTQAFAAPEGKSRDALLGQIQNQMMTDLPYFPLWFWKNAVIYDRRLKPPAPQKISRSGGLAPLLDFSEE